MLLIALLMMMMMMRRQRQWLLPVQGCVCQTHTNTVSQRVTIVSLLLRVKTVTATAIIIKIDRF